MSMKIVESRFFMSWLRYNTKYVIECYLESLYKKIKIYDKVDTSGILQYPRRIKEMTRYSYLVNNIGMGYHPTLKRNPISLEEVLELNPHKTDTKWTLFLEKYLTYHWNNENIRITRNKLNKTLNV